MNSEILATEEDGVLRLQINRPAKKNALTREMYTSLTTKLKDAEQSEQVRVVLLHGTDECFTSGNDLKDFLEVPPDGADSPVMQFLFTLSRMRKPVVALVAGPAIGIGTTMLLHCDLVYAAEDARFHLPFVNLGGCAEGGSSVLLPMLAGKARAAELLLLGEPFSAAVAREIGIVNKLCPASALQDEGTAVARKLAAKLPQALQKTKELLSKGTARLVEQAMHDEIDGFMQLLDTKEAREIINSFLKGR